MWKTSRTDRQANRGGGKFGPKSKDSGSFKLAPGLLKTILGKSAPVFQYRTRLVKLFLRSRARSKCCQTP